MYTRVLNLNLQQCFLKKAQVYHDLTVGRSRIL